MSTNYIYQKITVTHIHMLVLFFFFLHFAKTFDNLLSFFFLTKDEEDKVKKTKKNCTENLLIIFSIHNHKFEQR